MSLMALITKHISENLQAQCQKLGETPDSEILVHLKIFDLCGAATWYLTEQNPAQPDELFGLCSIFEDEWGYVSLSELERVQGPLGIGLERDLYWTPISVKALKDRLATDNRP